MNLVGAGWPGESVAGLLPCTPCSGSSPGWLTPMATTPSPPLPRGGRPPAGRPRNPRLGRRPDAGWLVSPGLLRRRHGALGSAGQRRMPDRLDPQSWRCSGAAEPPPGALGDGRPGRTSGAARRPAGAASTRPSTPPALPAGCGIRGYVPRRGENGGQYPRRGVGCDGLRPAGDSDQAWALLGLINPINHARSADGVATYKLEPYVVAADVRACPPHVGRGGWAGTPAPPAGCTG